MDMSQKKKTQQLVKKEIDRYKKEHRWKSRKQAIAVGLFEAREKGFKVPLPKK